MYLPLKKYVSFLIIDTASKDVLQKSGLSSTLGGFLGASGRLDDDVLPAVGMVVPVVWGAVAVTVVLVLADVVVVVGVVRGRSGLWEIGLYTGMSPHILSSFEPIKNIVYIYTTGVEKLEFNVFTMFTDVYFFQLKNFFFLILIRIIYNNSRQ